MWLHGQVGEIQAGEIQAQLEQMLKAPVFARAERQSRLLRFIVERALAGDGGALREVSIAVEVYGRPADFDSKEDTIVRVEASRLRSRLLDYYSGEGREDGVRISVPKGAYVPVFARKDEAGVAESEGPAAPAAEAGRSAWWVWGGVAAVVVAAAVGAGAYRLKGQAEKDAVRRVSHATYSRAVQLHRTATPASLKESLALHLEIAKRDPEWPVSHSGLAHLYITMVTAGMAREEEVAGEIEKETQRALELEPGLMDARSAQIRWHKDLRMDFRKAGEVCREALGGVADVSVLVNCSVLHMSQGNLEVARPLVMELMKKFPRYVVPLGVACEFHYRAREWDRAREICGRAQAAAPDSVAVRNTWALALAAQGDIEGGRRAHRIDGAGVGTDTAEWMAVEGYLAGRAGDRARALEMKDQLERLSSGRRTPASALAWVELGLGAFDKALDRMEEAGRLKQVEVCDLMTSPAAEPARTLGRFRALASKLGLKQVAGL